MMHLPDSACPVSNSHKRLEDAHSYWHDALAHYGDSNDFERHLNSCLQEMRNFSFLFQSEISGNSIAEAWYEEWRRKFKLEPLLAWLNDSRVTVVHRENLLLHSTAHVRIISTYSDAARELTEAISGSSGTAEAKPNPAMDYLVDPTLATAKVVEEILARNLPRSIVEQSTVSIERTWVADSLPDKELLWALSFCFGLYMQFMDQAHLFFASEMSECNIATSRAHRLESVRIAEAGARPACMVTTRSLRTLSVRLADGVVLRGAHYFEIQGTENLPADIVTLFGVPKKIELNLGTGPLESMEDIISQAQRIVLAGYVHETIAILFRKGVTAVIGIHAEDNADKRGIIQGIAEKCHIEGFDGIVLVGEMWSSPISIQRDGSPLPPANHPDKKEKLFVHAETKSGEIKSVLFEILRKDYASTIIGDRIQNPATDYFNFLEPLRAVWNL